MSALDETLDFSEHSDDNCKYDGVSLGKSESLCVEGRTIISKMDFDSTIVNGGGLCDGKRGGLS